MRPRNLLHTSLTGRGAGLEPHECLPQRVEYDAPLSRHATPAAGDAPLGCPGGLDQLANCNLLPPTQIYENLMTARVTSNSELRLVRLRSHGHNEEASCSPSLPSAWCCCCHCDELKCHLMLSLYTFAIAFLPACHCGLPLVFLLHSCCYCCCCCSLDKPLLLPLWCAAACQ